MTCSLGLSIVLALPVHCGAQQVETGEKGAEKNEVEKKNAAQKDGEQKDDAQKNEEKKERLEGKLSPADQATLKASKKAFRHIEKLIQGEKWGQFKSRLTRDAADKFCVMQLMGLWIPDDLPIPGSEESREKLNKVIKKHGLEELVQKFGNFDLLAPGDGEFDFDEKAILKELDSKGDRWKIMGDLWKAQQGSPFFMNPMSGKLGKGKIEDGVVYWELTPELPELDGLDLGAPADAVEILSPPIIVRMEKSGMQWKFGGIDEAKTEEVVQRYFEKMGIPGGAEFDLIPGLPPGFDGEDAFPDFGGPGFIPDFDLPEGVEIEEFILPGGGIQIEIEENGQDLGAGGHLYSRASFKTRF